MQGEMMDPMGGSKNSHHDRHVLTDLTVGLLQDTGWCVPSRTFQHLLLCTMGTVRHIRLSIHQHHRFHGF